MRADLFKKDVLAKCEAMKAAGFWPAEPRMRPGAWLNSFDDSDQQIAAVLLDRFIYYNEPLTEALLMAAYHSLGDGRAAERLCVSQGAMDSLLANAVFTRVDGETPRPTDSGNFFCRKARQTLGIPDDRFLEPHEAVELAWSGTTVVFLDDFVGSGDQFIKSWQAQHGSRKLSFQLAHSHSFFRAFYVALVATEYGLNRIAIATPDTVVVTAHTLDESATVRAIQSHHAYSGKDLQQRIRDLLDRYAHRLEPGQDIAQNPKFVRYGYHERGLMLAFAHSVPDATLPIFWSSGPGWTPLIERT